MNKKLRLICVLAILNGIISVSWSQDNLVAIKGQIAKGLYTEALASLNQHLSKQPSDAKSFALLAEVQMKLGKIDLACATYSMMESMKLCDDQVYYDYGIALKMNGKYDDAIAKFNKCGAGKKEIAQKQIQSCVFAKELIRTEDTKKALNLDLNTTESEYGALVYDQLVVFNSSKAPFMMDDTRKSLESCKSSYLCKTLQNGTAAAIFMEGKTNQINAEAISLTDNHLVAYSVSNIDGGTVLDRMMETTIYLGEYNGYNLIQVSPFEHNARDLANFSPCFTHDGTALYFASNRPGGFGGMDIYRSIYDGTTWSSPENLGDEVNTDGNEITPFYSDGLLWFASDSHEGLGGYDIFSAQNTGGGFLNVHHGGYGINSSGNDYFPYVKNLVMYFTSDRAGGKGMEDIYRSPLSEHNYTVEIINEPAMPDVIVLDEITEETPPPAYALNEASYTQKSVDNIDAVLTGARRVSMGEVILKDKPRVFFIQLASMASNNSDVTMFKPLTKFGNIYKVKINSATKVRLGYFLERGETDALLAKVRNSGFKDAFIVEQELSTSDLELMLSQSDVRAGSSEKTVTSNQNKKQDQKLITDNFEYTKPLPPSIEREYKVRLGSFEDPIWFDSKKVKDLGRLEQWTKGAWTIFILGGFTNYNEADQARIQAINRGYADAEVVIDNGGIIERIKKN
ncbi:MAG: PD40 domain-containing protein [Saprospiraceae bacterium]|nr:PD40 domain-containing protein [Saprospiraceae bacterium]